MMIRVWLSHLLSGDTIAYGGGKSFKMEWASSIKAGGASNASLLSLSAHLGTHIDLPKHFFDYGYTIDYLQPDYFRFKKISIAFIKGKIAGRIIRFDEIKKQILRGSDILLIKTGFIKFKGKKICWQNNPGLDPDIAHGLREYFPTVRAIGLDSISISSWANRELGRAAHKAFLKPDMRTRPFLIVEDMDLSKIKRGSRIKNLTISPLRVRSAEACLCTIEGEIDD